MMQHLVFGRMLHEGIDIQRFQFHNEGNLESYYSRGPFTHMQDDIPYVHLQIARRNSCNAEPGEWSTPFATRELLVNKTW